MLNAHAESFKTILGLYPFSKFLILIFVFFCVFDEFLNFLFRKTPFVIGNSNFGIFVGSFVSSLDIHYSIFVYLESNLDLRNSSWGRRNTSKVELSEKIIVFGHLALTLKDLDQDSGLVVAVGCENLRFLGGDSGVSWDEGCHYSTSCFNSK
jgi:hypothetical protein